MIITTAHDIGLVIRERRRELHLDQRGLAERIGVSRQWVVAVEKGKPRAEIGLILRTLRALDLHVVIDTGEDDIVFRPRRIETATLENLSPLLFPNRSVSIDIGAGAELRGGGIYLIAQSEDRSLASELGASTASGCGARYPWAMRKAKTAVTSTRRSMSIA